MQTAKGKLVNKDSGEALNFSLNPTDFRLTRHFDYHVEPCLGQHAPMVAFKSGGASQLSFNLRFDRDADKDCSIKTVHGFLRSLNKVDEDKKSIPQLEFTMGSFRFLGYPSSVSVLTTRFDDHGEATSLSIDLSLVSSGEYEHGK